MPTKLTIKGLKGLSIALKEFAGKVSKDIPDRTLSTITQETKSRLEQDTPVITGQLRGSTTIRKDGSGKQTLTQTAPYAAFVEARRGYWSGAKDAAEKWGPLYQKTVQDEWQIMIRKYANQ